MDTKTFIEETMRMCYLLGFKIQFCEFKYYFFEVADQKDALSEMSDEFLCLVEKITHKNCYDPQELVALVEKWSAENPMKHGKWIEHENPEHHLVEYECSECHETSGYQEKYCENCFAKMY